MIERASPLQESKMKILSAITIVVLLCCLEVAFGYPSRYPTRAREYLLYDDDRYVSAQEGAAILNISVTIITELRFSHSQGNTFATSIADAEAFIPFLLQTHTGPVVVMVLALSRRWAAASIVKVCQHHGY